MQPIRDNNFFKIMQIKIFLKYEPKIFAKTFPLKPKIDKVVNLKQLFKNFCHLRTRLNKYLNVYDRNC